MVADDKKNNKDYMLRVRMDKSVLEKLDVLCKKDNIKRSEITRLLIEKEYEKLKNKKKE